MAKASYGPAAPSTANSQGSINAVPIETVVKRTVDTPARVMEQKDGSVVTTRGNKREDY